MIRYSEEIKEQVRKEVQAGQSQREISRRYGISGYTVQSWCGLRPETKLRQAAPLRKGRPGKIKTIEDYEKENKRLKMENEFTVIENSIQYSSCANSLQCPEAAITAL